MDRFKLYLFVFVTIIISTFLFLPDNTYAANCGGSVVCACGDTVTASTTLTADLTCNGTTGLFVGANNVIIDGNNHSLTGDSGEFDYTEYGISNANGFDGVTIKNFSNITGFRIGIKTTGLSGGIIQNNTVSANTSSGVIIDQPSSNTISGNTITNHQFYGMSFSSSASSSTFINNSISNNGINFIITGSTNAQYENSIDTSNLVEGKPIYYFYGQSNQVYDGDVVGDIGMFWCISCTNVTVKNAILSPNNYNGVYFRNTSSSTIDNITTSSNYDSGIYLVSSNSNILSNNTVTSSDDGIDLYLSDFNNLTSNISNSNTQNGFTITNQSDSNTLYGNSAQENYNGSNVAGSSNIIDGNTFSLNTYGLDVGSNSNTIKNNTIQFNNYYGLSIQYGATLNNVNNNQIISNNLGLFIEDSDSNTISDNTFLGNLYDISNTGTSNTYSGNSLRDSIHITNKMVRFSEVNREISIGEIATTTISIYDIEGSSCSDCTYSISLSPSSDLLSSSKAGNTITSSFVPSKIGTYSVNISVTDTSGNISKRLFSFFVGETISTTKRFYFRSAKPTHGQPRDTQLVDGGSLTFTAPTSTESRNCTDWVQFSPDELPNYPISSLSSIYMYAQYKSDDETDFGIQRYVDYDVTIDASSSVPIAESYAWASSTFSNIDWSLDYPDFWYWLALKVNGYSPYLQTTAAQPSYADFTYNYTTAPSIKSVSNTNIVILSATAPSTSTTTPSIVLENRLSTPTSTTLALSSMGQDTYYQVTVDGLTSSSVSGSSCNTSGLCLTDSSGDLSFAYLASDSSSHIISLKSSPSSFSLSSPSDSYVIHPDNSMPSFSWSASSDNGSGIAKYQLYINNSLHTDNISSASTSVNIGRPSSGTYSWYIVAVDNNSNTTQSTNTLSFTISDTLEGVVLYGSPSSQPVITPQATTTISVVYGSTSTTTSSSTPIDIPSLIRELQLKLIVLLQQLLVVLMQGR